MARCSAVATETLFGMQTRYDDIGVSLWATPRSVCFCPTPLVDHVGEGNVGIYAQNTTRWTDWLQDHRRLAGGLFLDVGEFDPAAGQLRQCAGRDRQSEIHNDLRSLLQDRVVPRGGHGVSQQRRAWRDIDASCR